MSHSNSFLPSLQSAISRVSLDGITQIITSQQNLISQKIPTNIDTKNVSIALDDTMDYMHSAEELPLHTAIMVRKDDPESSGAHHEVAILAIVKYLVSSGFAINRKDLDGHTPLMLASSLNYERISRYLLNQDADASLLTNQNRSALSFACEVGNYNIVHWILSEVRVRNSKVDLINEPSRDKEQTPLHFAALSGSMDIVRRLVTDHSAEIDPADENGETPLFIAARQGNVPMVQFLVQNGADVLHLNTNCETAMVVAAQNMHSECVYILKGAWRMYRFQHETSNLQPAVSQLIHDVNVIMSRGNDLDSYIEPILLRLQNLEKNQRAINKKIDALIKRASNADPNTPLEIPASDDEVVSQQDDDAQSNSTGDADKEGSAEFSIWNEMVDDIESHERIIEERRYYESLGLIKPTKFTFSEE